LTEGEQFDAHRAQLTHRAGHFIVGFA